MPIVTMPDGTKVRFPDDMQKEQIQGLIAEKFPESVPDQFKPKEAPGFTERAGDVLRRAGAEFEEAARATARGEQSPLELAPQAVATQVRAAGEIGAEALPALAEAPMPQLGGLSPKQAGTVVRGLFPETTGALMQFGEDVAQSPIVQAGAKALEAGGELWQQFSEENPRAARNIGAAATLSAIGIPFKGKSAAQRIGEPVVEISRNAQEALRKFGEDLAPSLTAEDVNILARDSYKAARDTGGILKPEFSDRFLDEIQQFRPKRGQQLVTGRTQAGEVFDRLEQLRGKPIDLDFAQEIDEGFSELVDDFVDKTTGRIDKKGLRVLEAQRRFRNMIENADASMIEGGKEGFIELKKARKLWSTARKLEDIERIIQRAELSDNPATVLKSGFRNLTVGRNKLRGYTKKEKELIRKAAESGKISDALRILGSRLVPIVTLGSGGGLGGTAAAHLGSLAARSGATAVQARRAARILKEIEKPAKGEK